MVFLKGVLGGVFAVFVMWIVIVYANEWRVRIIARKHGITGLIATAGGWSYLLQLPSITILLATAFGVGLYLTVHRR